MSGNAAYGYSLLNISDRAQVRILNRKMAGKQKYNFTNNEVLDFINYVGRKNKVCL